MKIPLALGWGQKGKEGERGMAEGTYVVNGGTLFIAESFRGKHIAAENWISAPLKRRRENGKVHRAEKDK